MNADDIRELERESIRSFVNANAAFLQGRVLDFGAGKPGTCRTPQPFRHLVKGVYLPYDVGDEFPLGEFDAILCTQVMQYLPNPQMTLNTFHSVLRRGGTLVLTYPSNWPEVEKSDLFRFTRSGMERMLDALGFNIKTHVERAAVDIGGMRFALGYGVVAVAA